MKYELSATWHLQYSLSKKVPRGFWKASRLCQEVRPPGAGCVVTFLSRASFGCYGRWDQRGGSLQRNYDAVAGAARELRDSRPVSGVKLFHLQNAEVNPSHRLIG